jgi:hypothetical protein
VLIGLAVVAVLALALGGYAALSGRGSDPTSTGGTSKAGSATSTPSAKAGAKPGAGAKPTTKGMESFIDDYVAAVAADPASSWQMLTPKFQQESGGFATYSRFWGRATNGQVLSISADPNTMTVAYQVHFDDFDNGPGPTVLELTYAKGRYLIDGESTRGFTPSG